MERVCLVTTVTIGTLTRAFMSMTFWNCGVSEMFKRTYKPTNTNKALATKGMRQPHSRKSASGICVVSAKNTLPDKKKPIGPPSCGTLPYKARLFGGAFSVASKIAPPHSPPKPKPWPKRHTASKMGAAMPMAAYEGSRPMATVETPMVSSDATSVALRPMRSPKCPNKAEPTGRATKAKPKVASDCKMATLGSEAAKNKCGNTNTAAVPKM